MNNALLIIPIYNEEASLPDLLRDLNRLSQVDVLIVDDASTDHSLEITESFDNIRVISLAINLGAWGAIQCGLRYALRKNYQHVISMDGDGQHHINEIDTLLRIFSQNQGADVVIGACTQRGSPARQFAWRYFRRLTGVGIEDITSGFRLYGRKAIELLVLRKSTMLDFQDVGVLLALQQAGMTVVETEVKMSPRKSGKSHIYYNWFAVAYYILVTSILSLAKGKHFSIRRINR